MDTEYLTSEKGKLNNLSYLERAATLLQEGAVVAFPTETVYGLGCSMLNEAGIEKIYAVKHRDKKKPLSLLVGEVYQVKQIASFIPETFYLLAHKFLPGPLTIILKKHPALPFLLTGGKDSVAIRISSHPIARKLVQLVGCPLATTSANLSRQPSATHPKHVFEDLNGAIDAIIDGNETEYGIESTILSLEDPKKPCCLRIGAVPIEELTACLKQPISLALQASPLQKEAGQAVVRLFSSLEEMQAYLQCATDGKRVIMSQEGEKLPIKKGLLFQLSPKNFYEGLRLAYREGCFEVLILCDLMLRKNETFMGLLKQLATKHQHSIT